MLTLSAYVKGSASDTAYIEDCAEQALAMVDQYIAENLRPSLEKVPDPIKNRAVLEVGAELFYRRSARNGVVGLDTAEATPMRIARDPMRAAYDLLNPYMKPALA